jgi:2-furoyl-CoA dehydrogenase large subunit
LEPPDEDDRVSSSSSHGFIADVAVVEVDRETGAVRVLDYVTVHDAGRLLNPLIVEGQVRGGFAHGAGAGLFERIVYDDDGALLTGTFIDYLCPTAPDLPEPRISHRDSTSPSLPLAAKGLGEGNTMSAPAALANAVADALGLDRLELPLTPPRVWEALNG